MYLDTNGDETGIISITPNLNINTHQPLYEIAYVIFLVCNAFFIFYQIIHIFLMSIFLFNKNYFKAQSQRNK